MIKLGEKEQEEFNVINQLLTIAMQATNTPLETLVTDKKLRNHLKEAFKCERHFSVQMKQDLFDCFIKLLEENKIISNREPFEFFLSEFEKFKDEKPWKQEVVEVETATSTVPQSKLVLLEEEQQQLQIIKDLINADIKAKKLSEFAIEAAMNFKNLSDALREYRHFTVKQKNSLYKYFVKHPQQNPGFEANLEKLNKFKDERPWLKRKSAIDPNLQQKLNEQWSVIDALINLIKRKTGKTLEQIATETKIKFNTLRSVVTRQKAGKEIKNKLYDYCQMLKEDANFSTNKKFQKLLKQLAVIKDAKPWKKQKLESRKKVIKKTIIEFSPMEEKHRQIIEKLITKFAEATGKTSSEIHQEASTGKHLPNALNKHRHLAVSLKNRLHKYLTVNSTDALKNDAAFQILLGKLQEFKDTPPKKLIDQSGTSQGNNWQPNFFPSYGTGNSGNDPEIEVEKIETEPEDGDNERSDLGLT